MENKDMLGLTSKNCIQSFRSSRNTKYSLSLNRNFHSSNKICRLHSYEIQLTQKERADKDFATCFFNFIYFCFTETFNLAKIAFRSCLNCLSQSQSDN